MTNKKPQPLHLKMKNKSRPREKHRLNVFFFSLRSSNLTQMNTLFREQLDQAHLANQQLTDDLRRSTTELQQVRDELVKKTKDWKEEERVRSDERKKERETDLRSFLSP